MNFKNIMLVVWSTNEENLYLTTVLPLCLWNCELKKKIYLQKAGFINSEKCYIHE